MILYTIKMNNSEKKTGRYIKQYTAQQASSAYFPNPLWPIPLFPVWFNPPTDIKEGVGPSKTPRLLASP